jgi:hypothetical protein
MSKIAFELYGLKLENRLETLGVKLHTFHTSPCIKD